MSPRRRTKENFLLLNHVSQSHRNVSISSSYSNSSSSSLSHHHHSHHHQCHSWSLEKPESLERPPLEDAGCSTTSSAILESRIHSNCHKSSILSTNSCRELRKILTPLQISSRPPTYLCHILSIILIFIVLIALRPGECTPAANEHNHDRYFPFHRSKTPTSVSSQTHPKVPETLFSSSSSSVGEVAGGCRSCRTAAQLAAAQVEALKLDAIKQQILSKLNLAAPPTPSQMSSKNSKILQQSPNSVALEHRRERALEAIRRSKQRAELEKQRTLKSRSSKKQKRHSIDSSNSHAHQRREHRQQRETRRLYRKLLHLQNSTVPEVIDDEPEAILESDDNDGEDDALVQGPQQQSGGWTEEERWSTTSGDDSYYGLTSEIIAFAEPGANIFGHDLIEFEPPHDATHRLRVRSATLWVRLAYNRTLIKRLNRRPLITRPVTLFVYRVKSRKDASPSTGGGGIVYPTPLYEQWQNTSSSSAETSFDLLTTFRVSKPKRGWLQLDLTSAVSSWFTESDRQERDDSRLKLLVQCSGCGSELEMVLIPRALARARRRQQNNPNYRGSSAYKATGASTQATNNSSSGSSTSPTTHQLPFMVIETEPRPKRRTRRHAYNCEDGSGATRQCCRQSLYVDFKALGWDHWIIYPKGYNANYCKGDCGSHQRTPDTLGYYHSHIIEEYRQRNPYASIQPCCAPTKLSPISIIYMDPDGHVIKSDLPKMVVEQCGCT